MLHYEHLFAVFIFSFVVLVCAIGNDRYLPSNKPSDLDTAIENSTFKYWLADLPSKSVSIYLDKQGFGEYGWRIRVQSYSDNSIQEFFALSNGDNSFQKNKWSAEFYPKSDDMDKKVDKSAGMEFSMELVSPYLAIATFKSKDDNTTPDKIDYGKIRLAAS